MSQEVISLLQKARARITDPKNHTTNVFARNKNNFYTDPTLPDATCWCAVGALRAEAPVQPILAQAVQALSLGMPEGRTNIANFNDESTHTEVLEMFDKAIAALESGTPIPHQDMESA